jgi:hypothetical protein
MLMINESSLSTVEIGLDSDFKAFYIKEEKRREKKKGEKQERERESSNGKNGLCRHLDRRERERMILFTFLDLCEGKRKKKKERLIIVIIIILINLSYFTMILLYWGLI